ncbi:chromatin/chromatin-binding, or -regulatory protein [Lithospermum erythrorhizon]|uniref:Chromatin/chromatin-binding, or -regulatory protein n=1 Tax=Lithospermum erythrorhizon TaxID=34254 RepID=A0AAV3Q321_LITER
MKIRTIKLRQVHNPNATSTASSSYFCSILYDQKGEYIITASTSEPSISIQDALLLSSPPKILCNHLDGVTVLAISPNSTCLASGSIDHSVKLYKFPSGEFQTNITRFTLPIRALAFNRSGTLLAAAGDDDGIKLINTIDGSIARVLKGHKGSITGLSFDPKSEYMASIDAFGSVIIWELQSGRIIHDLKGIAPDTGSDLSVKNVVEWSPDGEMLAVPGRLNDVVMYDRDTAEKKSSFIGDHMQPVCFLSWSPNGRYMATSGLDNQVLIWDVKKNQDIDRHKFENRVTSIAWKPHGNALAVIDSMGRFGVWESAVPPSMKSPTEDIPLIKTGNGFQLFDEEDEEEEPSISGSFSDPGEDSHGESEPPSHKRLRKDTKYQDEWQNDDFEKLGRSPQTEPRKRSSYKDVPTQLKDGVKISTTSEQCKLQEAFQPGATPVQPGKRRFLCYNMLGCVTSMDHDGFSHIEVDFHDTSSGPRVPAMTDYFGFTMASLNEDGSVFANPCKGEKHMSTLMYRPFSSWASNSEWSMRFEDEEVRAVALGSSWVAAVTNLNLLRIFSGGGLQRHIISLDGPVVTAAGFNDLLAVITHVSSPLPSNEQVLEFRVFNIHEGTQPIRGLLPLTPGSHLSWFGYTEEGRLSSFDSKGILRVFMNQFGGSWLPLFSARKAKKSDENYWVVGLSSTKLFSVMCKSPDIFPQATPKPVLTLLDLSFPLAASDLGAESLENEFMMNNMRIAEIQKTIEELAVAGHDTTALDDEAFNTETALDRCILRLIGSCCNGDKLVRATELVKLLTLEKSVRGAIKLATAMKLPNLADRFNTILEERLNNETIGKAVPQEPISNANAFAKADRMFNKFIAPQESSKAAETSVPSPTFIKKQTVDEGSKSGKRKAEQTQINNKSAKCDEVEIAEKLKNVKGTKSLETTKVAGVNNETSHRPSNPFAKPSSNQGDSSLFDTLKKMKS